MAEKILNTRIQLKYDTLANWKTKNTLLKQGEVAFAEIGEAGVDAQGRRIAPPVMFKVGPGNFNDLGWGAATAADVYSWAKEAGLPVDTTKASEGQFVEGFAWENNKLVPKFRGFITEINETNKNKLDAPTTKAVKDYVDGVAADIVAKGTVVAAGDKIDVTHTGNTYTVSHKTITQAEAGKTVTERTYVTGVTTDGYGHITGYTTATETDQDTGVMSVNKENNTAIKVDNTDPKNPVIGLVLDPDEHNGLVQTNDGLMLDIGNFVEVDDKIANAAHADAAAKVDHALTIGTKTFDGSAAVEVTPADLGLESAMHFVGAFTEAPDSAVNGDVYLNTANKKEYVYSNGWVELGDEGSYALRNVTITGNNGLTGGGDLTTNRTIGIADSGVTTAKIADKAVTEAKLADEVTTKLNKQWQPVGSYKTKQTAVNDMFDGSYPQTITSLTQNANGEIDYSVAAITPAGIGALTNVTAGVGIKATKTDTTVNLEVVGKGETDDDGQPVTWILDCGGAE